MVPEQFILVHISTKISLSAMFSSAEACSCSFVAPL